MAAAEPLPSLEPGAPPPRFATEAHAKTAAFLHGATTTGRLGSGPVEPDYASQHVLRVLWHTLPVGILSAQLIWSSVVLFAAYHYALRYGDPTLSTFSVDFWTSRLNVAPSVSHGIGWALFVLLGFFIREASQRFRESQSSLESVSAYLRQVVRILRMQYPRGSWHEGDYDRIAAHLVAYPVALKMALRGEREREQLEPILNPDDIDDIIAADFMHVQCLRVVRAYLAAAEDDSSYLFDHSAATKTYAGDGVRFFNILLVDSIDFTANVTMRIAQFRPSVGYVNHLEIFLYIWMFFLPLSLVKTSGWFTVPWAVIITYVIGMLFTIANALNEPYGHDVQDVKLNRFCARIAYDVLVDFSANKIDMTQVVRADHETPAWLEQPVSDHAEPTPQRRGLSLAAFSSLMSQIWSAISENGLVIISLALFVVWTAGIVHLTEILAQGGNTEAAYLPVSTTTTSYVGLGVFLLLAFWLNDAYGRYWRGLQIWQTAIQDNTKAVAHRINLMCKRGTWHQRDRERIFSHLVAIPLAAKAQLRGSRDLSEIAAILDSEDVKKLADAPDLPFHCITVVYAYILSEDSNDEDLLDSEEGPMSISINNTIDNIWSIEKGITECRSLQKHEISPCFTNHLRICVLLWLALLPVSLAAQDGLWSLTFLLPIGYSIVHLLVIGSNLADPFGYDEEDVPLDMYCNRLKRSMHDLYHEGSNGYKSYIVPESEYSRRKFTPGVLSSAAANGGNDRLYQTEEDALIPDSHEKSPTFSGSLNLVLKNFPSVDGSAMLYVVIWTIIAVFGSWTISKIWPPENSDGCRGWCSPTDINGSILANIGFALFLILSFRASDGITRYESGASMLVDLQNELRCLSVEMTNANKDGFFHPGDKERIVAHLVQIPLILRDELLEVDRSDLTQKVGILSNDDYHRVMTSSRPFERLTRTIHSYILLQDSKPREEFEHLDSVAMPPMYTINMLYRIANIERIASTIAGVKEVPVIDSYYHHQRLFTAIWLAFLPLSMTKLTGFLAILWAPLVSYGVFALEEFASKLADPYGTDYMDLPIDEYLTEAANNIVEAVNSTGWDSYYHTRPAQEVSAPYLGAVVQGNEVHEMYTLARFQEPHESPESFGDGQEVAFNAGHPPKMKPSMYAHFLRSVPWWVLAAVTMWTAFACTLSYMNRHLDAHGERWWTSSSSVSVNVATYVSFAAFMLLGFYVEQAFKRYEKAGEIWADNLRAACHALAVQMINFFPDGTIHEGDQDRLFGHIAAIPLVLKHELRGSRDIREAKGFLSYGDFARIQTSHSMVLHCVDVIRAYYNEFLVRTDRHEKEAQGNLDRDCMVIAEINTLETAIASCQYLNEFDIAPGFLVLLNMLLGIWFLLLPFVLAELSGWFTILWVPMIAYGLFGMYKVAAELQGPFGSDLNDLDLDKVADDIVRDVLFVQRNYRAGTNVLVRATAPSSLWDEENIRKRFVSESLFEENDETMLDKIKLRVWLGVHAVERWQMLGVLVWSLLTVGLSWIVSKEFPIPNCQSEWFCSYIAVNGSVKQFVGFALFLLIGFRLYDSHFRYVQALRIWQDGLIGNTRVISNRMLQSYGPEFWHENDRARICGHLAAFAICLMGSLRGHTYEEKLREVLGDEDVSRLLVATERVDYCIDVVRAYLLQAERVMLGSPDEHHASFNAHMTLLMHLRSLAGTAFECRKIVMIPMPFGYVQHLRIFLIIWLALLPLGLVEATGWLTILWAVVIAYGVIGTEQWSEELSDPFGEDVSDVPLEQLCDRVVGVLVNNLATLKDKGAGTLIRPERRGFGDCTEQ